MTAAQSWLTFLSFLYKISDQSEHAVIIIHCLAQISKKQTNEKEVDNAHDFVILKNSKTCKSTINLSKAGQMIIII